MRRRLLLLLIFVSLNIFGQSRTTYKIIPPPQRIEILDGELPLDSELKLFVTQKGEERDYCIKELQEISKKNNLSVRIVDRKEKSNVELQIVGKLPFDCLPEVVDEAYSLEVNKNRVVIKGTSFKGLFYGLQTFAQILEQSPKHFLQQLKIYDFPDLQIRGVSDDISRGQVSTLKNFEKIIDFLAKYKMNVYMPYLEDMLQFNSFPTIGKNRGALSKEEVRKLVAYAKSKFVQIIPIFQTLGHYENILSQEEFLKYAEFPGAATLDVSNPETYVFLDKLLKEVTDLFPSVYFHMGADESFDVGLGNSKGLVDSLGIAKVHANHYLKVYNILKKYGKKVMMYGDIILRQPEILELIPKDIVIVDWHYRPALEYPSVKKFRDAGFQVIVSPASWNFLTTYPTNINALPNIKEFARVGVKNGALGMINSNWGDYGAETFKELLYWDYAWSASCSWNVSRSNISDFNALFFERFFGLPKSGTAVELNLWYSNPLNQFLWHEIWRHPLLPIKKAYWWIPNVDPTARIMWLKETLPLMIQKTEELKKNVSRNKEQIKIYEFLNSLYSWYSLKLGTTLTLIDTTLSVQEEKEVALPLIAENLEQLKKLKENFRAIWLKYYKPANLNLIDDKFNRLAAYFKETSAMLRRDTLYSPLIPSKWIYCQVSEDSLSKKADFLFTFDLGKKVSSAKLQLMGNTYAELFVNNRFVTKVYARRTLSLTVEYGRVKFVEIKKYLKQGENEIEVHAINYNRKGGAGVNVIGQIKFDDGTVFKILSDETWKSKPQDSLEYGDSTVVKDYRYEVIAPNFETNRPSWIER